MSGKTLKSEKSCVCVSGRDQTHSTRSQKNCGHHFWSLDLELGTSLLKQLCLSPGVQFVTTLAELAGALEVRNIGEVREKDGASSLKDYKVLWGSKNSQH